MGRHEKEKRNLLGTMVLYLLVVEGETPLWRLFERKPLHLTLVGR